MSSALRFVSQVIGHLDTYVLRYSFSYAYNHSVIQAFDHSVLSSPFSPLAIHSFIAL